MVHANLWEDPLLAPVLGFVRSSGASYMGTEGGMLVGVREPLEDPRVMPDIKKAAGAALVNDLIEGVALTGGVTIGGSAERDVLGK